MIYDMSIIKVAQQKSTARHFVTQHKSTARMREGLRGSTTFAYTHTHQALPSCY